MIIPAWKSFSPAKKLLTILIAIFGLIAIGVGYVFVQDVEIVIPSTRVSYVCESGKSALISLLKNHTTKLQQTALGVLVVEIDGMAQSEGKYWQYLVNSQPATIGAEVYICQGSEQILWELK